jgi:alpha-aminoadipate carrier protein LysW
MAHCPECEAVLDIDMEEVEEGQLVSCPDCGVELEVVNTNPVELDLAEDDEEEADDEDDLEDEDMDYDDDDEDEEEEENDEDIGE